MLALLIFLSFLIPYTIVQMLIVRQVLASPLIGPRTLPLLTFYMSFIFLAIMTTAGFVVWLNIQ